MNDVSQNNLPFTKLGHGRKPLLAFHGIGQDGVSCFENFAASLDQQYTTFAFDLPFHGGNANFPFQPISKTFLEEKLTVFLEQENIDRFDVAGFSIGGRFAMAAIEIFADRIDRVYLMAPDGITENPLYSLATRYTLPRNAFKWAMQHPTPFFRTIHILQKTGLLNKSIVRFTEQILNTQEKRDALFKSWVAYSALRFDMKKLYSIVVPHNVKILLFTGKYDKLVNFKTVAPLGRLLPENQKIDLKTGHGQLVNQAGGWISAYLTKLSDTES